MGWCSLGWNSSQALYHTLALDEAQQLEMFLNGPVFALYKHSNESHDSEIITQKQHIIKTGVISNSSVLVRLEHSRFGWVLQ